jgi:hypothetical protein
LNFKELEKQMNEQLGKVAQEMQEKEEKPSYVDERLFKPKADSAGNVSCIIRFLPFIDFSKPPYIKKWTHYVNAGGKKFFCECLNNGDNKQEECLVCKKAKPLWDEYWSIRNAHGKDHPSAKETVKKADEYTAKPQVITNILVIKNPADPETEGKVFLYSMGKTVWEKYQQKLMPKDELDERVIIYHPTQGRNFKLEGVTKEFDGKKMPSYDNSYFYDKTTPISENEEEIMRILNETYDLQKYANETKPDKEDIEKRWKSFSKFLGESVEKTPKRVEKTDPIDQTPEEIIDDEIEEIEELSSDDIDDLFDE